MYACAMRAPILMSLIALVAIPVASAEAHKAATTKFKPGLYGPKASETTSKNGGFEYSNGAVNFELEKDGKTLTRVGVACNIGASGTEVLRPYDEVSITIPKHLELSSSGRFSFSGSVTLTPEEAQAESSVTTTFTIKGRFTGKNTAEGSDSSPLCQASTPTHFRVKYAEPLTGQPPS
jgi:hypothetical protein